MLSQINWNFSQRILDFFPDFSDPFYKELEAIIISRFSDYRFTDKKIMPIEDETDVGLYLWIDQPLTGDSFYDLVFLYVLYLMLIPHPQTIISLAFSLFQLLYH